MATSSIMMLALLVLACCANFCQRAGASTSGYASLGEGVCAVGDNIVKQCLYLFADSLEESCEKACTQAPTVGDDKCIGYSAAHSTATNTTECYLYVVMELLVAESCLFVCLVCFFRVLFCCAQHAGRLVACVRSVGRFCGYLSWYIRFLGREVPSHVRSLMILRYCTIVAGTGLATRRAVPPLTATPGFCRRATRTTRTSTAPFTLVACQRTNACSRSPSLRRSRSHSRRKLGA